MTLHHEEDTGVKGLMILGHEKGWEETEPGKDLVGHWFESSTGYHYKYFWEVDDHTVQFWLNDKQSNMSFRANLAKTALPSPAHGNGRAVAITS